MGIPNSQILAPPLLTMELVIDTANHCVLFAQVTKGAVDYLHSLLASPDMSLAFENATAGGCVSNLYDSIETLDFAARAAGVLVPPPAPAPSSSAGQQPAKRFFECGDKRGANCALYVADARGASCPSCGRKMKAEVLPQLSSPGAGCSGGNAAAATGGGGADASVMCLLKDDLTVMPMPASELALTRNIALYVLSDAVSVAALERRTVQLGYTEGLAILEASLQSSNVLTDVFLGDKALRSCMESIQNMEIK